MLKVCRDFFLFLEHRFVGDMYDLPSGQNKSGAAELKTCVLIR